MQFTGEKNFRITLLHPSRGRALKAKATLDYWMFRASKEYGIEHVLSLDNDDPQRKGYLSVFENSVVTENENDCVVQATNHAARIATGDILIYLSDDFKCPMNWDKLIVDRMHTYSEPLLIKVDDCLQPFNADVLTIPIMNKALYQRLGYFFHPEYRSMFCDQQLYWVCHNHGWMKLCPEMKFPHEHHVKGTVPNDDTYKRSAANWNQGKALYHKHKSEGFPI
jgi:hypothetical protein